jgi:hypothetical protein
LIIVLLSVLSLSCGLLGGNRPSEPAQEAPPPTSAPASGQEEEQEQEQEPVESGGSEQEPGDSGGVDLKDVPVYPGATVVEQEPDFNPPGAMQYEVVDRIIYEVDGAEAAHEFYLDRMPAEGWEKLMAMQFPEGSAISGWLSGNREDAVMVSVGEGPEGKVYLTIMQVRGIE